ncbi:hypothetical protein GQ54DRAFT_194520 [Martensiomyces pterosporus]|nr:hypothetical protein GQ54DRAFT_194520 [Martensiomyces pterosporus]
MAAECAVSAQLPAGDGGALKGGISRAMLKPYRCAMAGCNHQYKNVNGLEYHIFHSRKSDNHLLMGTAGRSATDSNEGGGSSGGTPDAPMAEHSPMVDTPLNDSVAGSALGLADSLSAPFNQQPPGGAVAVQGVGSPADMAGGAGSAGFLLQCTEVECLASFTSEHKLRQHMATQHPRPIRRATKPSYRVKSGRNNPGAATMDSPSSSSSFWNSANLSDVLSAAAANMDATGNSQVGAMPTIPEGEVSASNEATVAAIAAAIGYGDARGVSTPGVAGLTTLDQAAASVSRQLPSSLLFQAGISATPGAFNPTSPSFMSAPALISVTGGEPTNAGSYFALNMSSSANAQQHQHQQQPAPHPHQLTQALLGNPHSADAIAGTPGISMAPASAAAAASVMLAAMNQAAAAQAGSQSFNLQGSNASGAANPSSRGDESGGAEAFASHYLREMGVDSLSLDMQLVQSMLSPFYTQTPNNAGGSSANGNEGSPARAPAMGFAKLSAEGAGDVDMEDTRNGQYHYPRSQRSDSIDLSSLATMPTSIGPAANSSDAVSEAADPSISTSAADSILSVSTDGAAQSAQSTQQQQQQQYSANSGAHSQIAATLMSKRNAQQQLQQQQGAAPWMQDLSALGLLSIPKDDSGGHALQANLAQQQLQQPQQRKRYVLSAHAGDLKSRRDWHVLQQEQQQQQIYTPQPLDVTHFQQQQQQPRHGFAQNMGPATIPIGTRYHRQFMQPFPFPQTQAGDAPSLVAQQPGNSIIRCPLPMCGQGFSDANALKHHLSFDHPHDDATMLPRSHPGSPEDGFLSTLPIHGTLADGTDSGSGKQAKPSSGSMANAQLPYVGRSTSLISMVADPLNSGGSAMPLPQQQAGASSGSAATGGGGDRTKAPHWVDPNLWSMWIAAANGQGDITAAAAATAMGITPGVVGPQTFLPSHPASSPQQFSQQQQQQHSENELLRMFESLPSENSQQQQLSLDQQIAMAESVLSNHISAPVSSAAGAQPSVRAPLLAKSISHRPPQA